MAKKVDKENCACYNVSYKKEVPLEVDSMNSMMIAPGIHAYDGYSGEPFWKAPRNESTYDDPVIDNQCRVPSKPIDEVRKELLRRRKELNED